MDHNSKMLLTLWSGLDKVHGEIMNTVLPAAGYCHIEDQKLLLALQDAADAIERHFDRFSLSRLYRIQANKQ